MGSDRTVTGVSITRIDGRTLDTATWDGDQVAASTRRTASADGDLLVVVQTTTRRDGPAVRPLQVYRRQARGRVAS